MWLIIGWLIIPLAAGQNRVPGYGDNPDQGSYADINGIKMYYEVYGEGEPMALIHGSGQDIAAMRHQINYFAGKYQVVVADSRAHGKSGLGEGELNYIQMADDWANLFRHLKLGPVKVVVCSDGGNIGLRMAVDHPELIGKLATMGATCHAVSFRREGIREFTVQPAGTPLNGSWHRFLCASIREWMEKICEGSGTSAISR